MVRGVPGTVKATGSEHNIIDEDIHCPSTRVVVVEMVVVVGVPVGDADVSMTQQSREESLKNDP